MGPRSSDRGNGVLLAMGMGTGKSLQWGRDHLIAEIRNWSRSSPRNTRFNGAAII